MIMELDQRNAIEKAIDRAKALGDDLEALKNEARESRPAELVSDQQKRKRRDFLLALYGNANEGLQAFERVLQGNELQDASYLWRGALAARTVMRIVLRRGGGGVAGYGTGFLVADGVLVTNNHVLPSADVAARAEAQSQYERDAMGVDLEPESFAIEPGELFFTSVELDFTIVAVARTAKSGNARLGELGWVPLIGTTGKVGEGEWLTIVQHPKGERKQVCVRENQLLRIHDDVLWYSTDTEPGSSGSPVFNNDWLVVALHHSGVPRIVDGKWQTVDGRDYDESRDGADRIDWVANEGVRTSRIVDTLRADPAMAAHPLVRPILDSRVVSLHDRLPVLYPDGVAPPCSATPIPISEPKEDTMTSRRITVTLEIDDTGNARVVGTAGGAEAALAGDLAFEAAKKKNLIDAPVNPAEDWKEGFAPDFLGTGNLRVNLPKAPAQLIAPLKDAYGQTFSPAQKRAGELKYKGYSVVMNRERRFAFFSAANVDGGMRPNISGRSDDWLWDDRIERAHQIDNSFYKNDRFDRGHLTRRDDMEWGDDVFDAVNRANGTCTWTNCVPQHEKFNQGKEPGVLLWQQLEKYILEQTAADGQFKLQVITGPIFGNADPEYRKIQYPLDFWKVVAGVWTAQDGKKSLFATGYILSQKDMIDKYGLEEAAEIPLGAFGTYQRSIATIEDATGLKFTYGANRPLSEVDALTLSTNWRGRGRRRRGGGAHEGFGAGADDALASLDEIVLF